MCGTSLDEDRSNWLDRVQGGDRDNRSNLCVGIVQLMLCPLVFTVLFHKTMGKALGFLWLCCVSCLVALSVWRESVYLGVATVYYLAFSSLIVYEIISKSESEIVDRSLVSTFHEEVLQLHTQHMKTIVGNVAHDLKTPLSSFMAGVELVRELTEEVILKADESPTISNYSMKATLYSNEYGNTLHHTVIAISANNDSDVIQEARGCGFDEFIPKPFSLEAFLTVFEKFDA
eukprot:gene10778-11978_t